MEAGKKRRKRGREKWGYLGITHKHTHTHTQTKTKKEKEEKMVMDDDVEGWGTETVEEGRMQGRDNKRKGRWKSYISPYPRTSEAGGKEVDLFFLPVCLTFLYPPSFPSPAFPIHRFTGLCRSHRRPTDKSKARREEKRIEERRKKMDIRVK
jgi:hypothetical protein